MVVLMGYLLKNLKCDKYEDCDSFYYDTARPDEIGNHLRTCFKTGINKILIQKQMTLQPILTILKKKI